MADPAIVLPCIHRRLEEWQRENMWSYCWAVHLPLLICGGCFTTILYGFNVFALDIRNQFEGGRQWSLASGGPVYIGSLAILALSMTAAIVGGKMAGGPDDSGRGLRIGCLGGAVFYCAGLLISAFAMASSQLWLLYIGFSILTGCGSAGLFLSLVISTLLNFREAGHGGLGAGLVGLVLGLWPAAMSFAGPAMIDEFGTPNTFMILAGASFLLCLPPAFLLRLPPKPLTAVANSTVKATELSDHATQDEPPIAVGEVDLVIEDDQKTVMSSTSPGNLTHIDLLRQGKFWLTAIGVSCIMLPGFGIKLLIGPQIYAIHQSSQEEQSSASVIFMIAYGVMRLLTGFFADRFNVKLLFVIIGCLQVAALNVLGFCVHYSWSEAWNVTLDAVVGLCLAGSKVLMQIWCLQVWGAANSGLALGMVNVGFGVAAILGSVSAWWALCQLRVDDRPIEGDLPELKLTFAAWLWTCSILTAVGVLCVAIAPVNGPLLTSAQSRDLKSTTREP